MKLYSPNPMLLLGLLALNASFANAASGDIANNIANGMAAVMSDANGLMGAYGASSAQAGAQFNALSMQLGQAQQMAGGAAAQQSAFNEINSSLGQAAMKADMCVRQANNASYEKFYAKRSAKEKDIIKGLTPDVLASAEPTCHTAPSILDAIAMNKAKLGDAYKKMSCLTSFRNDVNQIADKAKAPFQALSDSAGTVYKTSTAIVDAHTTIAKQLDTQLNGVEGKGGYREQLNILKQMKLQLNDVLNGASGSVGGEGGQGGLKTGLAKAVEDLQQTRTSAANQMYYQFMSNIEYCFYSKPAACFNNNKNLPPAQCLSAVVSNVSQGGGAQAVRGQNDQQAMSDIAQQNSIESQDLNLPANLDARNPQQFLQFVNKRFQQDVSKKVANYSSHIFSKNIDAGKVSQFVQQRYAACYASAEANFQTDLASKGSRYYAAINSISDQERLVANDLKNWIDRVEGQMTEFRTAFKKVYNSDLAQFKTDCTSSGDPYKDLDCLRVLDAELDSGIRGTRVNVKLSNGSISINSGQTTISMQNLQLDASGNPTVGSTSASCSGFDDCINYMDRSLTEHQNAAQKAETDRKNFVEQHNTAVKSAFDVVSKQFAQMGQSLVASVGNINNDLTKLGLKAALKTKDVEGEELTPNENTGIMNMPKSMKAALAGRNTYTEMDEDTVKAVTEEFDAKLADMNKTAIAAAKMNAQCKINKSEYQALGNFVKQCSNTQALCGGSAMTSTVPNLANIFRKSGEKVDDNNDIKSVMSDYNSCKRDMLNEAKSVGIDEVNAAAIAKTGKPIDPESTTNAISYAGFEDIARNKKKIQAKQDIHDECDSKIFESLGTLAGAARSDGLAKQNGNILQKLKDISDACGSATFNPSTGKYDENEEVNNACEAFKSEAEHAKAPDDQEPTNADKANGSSKSSSNPISLPGSSSAE